MTVDPLDAMPCRPWTLRLEVEHLGGPPFDLDRHGEAVEAEIFDRLRDVVLHLSGGTTIRIETHLRRTGDETLPELEAQP